MEIKAKVTKITTLHLSDNPQWDLVGAEDPVDYKIELDLPLGWACPNCQRVNSPEIKTCICHDKAGCYFCKEIVQFWDYIGYGSKYDGKPICPNCTDLALDWLVQQRTEEHDKGQPTNNAHDE